ncbi:extracellular protease [Arenimonas soli]|uniref:Extracellular protease n=1 Tax=Arenimonas soli TaxID=2269504 RepID=A0ABQ1HT98_9GAMM|nr:extracellular protease [Arenimonas soli]
MSNNTRKLRLRGIVVATSFALAAQAAFAAGAQPAPRVDLSAIASDTQFDRFIVKYKAGTPEASNPAELSRALQVASVNANQLVQAARLQKAGRAAPGKPLAASHVRRMSLGADVVASSQKLNAAEAETLMRQIAANPNVEYVQIDRVMKHTLTPNDTNYSQQWGYTDADAGIRANTAWDLANGSGIIVAVLDTGYVAHSDLAANIVAGYDFISNTTTAGDGNGRDSDASDPGDYYGGDPSSWHGTHVAGTVAAVTNNAKGVAGTAWGAKVMPVRVLGRGGGSTSDIADAIIWASGGSVSGVPTLSAANAADVINLSLGGSGSCDTTTQNAINSAVGRGTVVVVAAGNSNANASGFTPASCNNVVNVASVTSASARSSFSNYGTSIDVSAPGSNILSTLNSGTQGPGTENYVSYNGTSMAAPHVAGAVALAQSRRLALGLALWTPAQVEANLKSTAYPLSGACSGGCGAGIIDARALVDLAGGGGTPPPPPPTGGSLTKGVAVTGLAATTGNSLYYTLSVPAGSSNLVFNMSGGTGDADLYVQFGSQPTDTAYVCRPYLSGNTETCTIAAPSAGTYHVRVKAYSGFSGVSLVGNYTAGGGSSPQTYSNTADYQIRDNATVESPISVSGRSGNAPSNASVAVNIVHTYKGDLKVDLVAPDGSTYNLHNRSGGSADNIVGTYTVNLSSEALNGTWKLRVNDNAGGDTGYINSWSVTF